MIQVQCPSCAKSYEVPETKLGSRVKCKSCTQTFTLANVVNETRHSLGRTDATILSAEPVKSSSQPVSAAPQRLGRFEILHELGSGAFGTVYKALDTQLDRIVALKVPRFGTFGGEEDTQRFLREAKAAGQLRHPNIVSVYDAGQFDGVYYIASAYIEGKTLRQRIAHSRKLSHKQAAELIRKLALALHFAHLKGIIHRDIKPDNVMIDGDGEPHIMDFGLARRDEDGVMRTQDGKRMGTPAYMSPEQHAGKSHEADARSDLWSLGVILYEMITGERPFQAGNELQMRYAVCETEPASPRKLTSSISKDLDTICLKCLAKDPDQRYPSCQHLVDELQRWRRGEPLQGRPIGTAERAWRWYYRNAAIASLSTVAAVALFGNLSLSYFAARANRQAAKARTNAEMDRTEKASANEAAKHAKWAADLKTAEAIASAKNERKEKDRADEAMKNARRHLYVAHMNLAQVAFESGRAEETLRLLDLYQPRAVQRAGSDDLRGFEWYYWYRLCGSFRLELKGHTHRATSVAFAADGTRLATAHDKSVSVWDVTNGQQLLTWKAHDDEVRRLTFSPDGRRLASAGSYDNTVKVWDATSGHELFSLQGHADEVNSVAFSTDGKLLASGSDDQTVKVWGVTSGRNILTLNVHPGWVTDVAFSPDGRRLASAGGYDNTVKVWSLLSGNMTLVLNGHTSRVSSVAYSPDGQNLASGSFDETVKIWDATSGREKLKLHGDTGAVYCVAFSPDGNLLASTSNEKVVVWDATAGRTLFTLRGHKRSVESVAFSPDGKRLASAAGLDPSVIVWDVTGGHETLTLKGHTSWRIGSVAFTSDGRLLASTTGLEPIILWDIKGSDKPRALKGHTGTVRSIAFTTDGQWLASGGDDGTVRVWDILSGHESVSLQLDSGVRSVGLSPDGKRLVVGSGETITVLDATIGREILELEAWSAWRVSSVSLSPDGKHLASGSDQIIKLWDATSGRELLSLQGHADAVTSVSFSPDGKRLASGSKDQSVKIWDVATGQELLTLKGHTGEVTSVAFSQDGNQLASASLDQTVKVWDATPRFVPRKAQ